MNKKEKCKLCGEKTSTVFNIKLKPVPICDKCSLTITKQEVMSCKLQGGINE